MYLCQIEPYFSTHEYGTWWTAEYFLNVAAKYELVNPVEFSTYTDAAKSFYVSQNLDVSEYFDNSENSTELFNRIHTSQDNPTGITYLDSSGSLVR